VYCEKTSRWLKAVVPNGKSKRPARGNKESKVTVFNPDLWVEETLTVVSE